MKSYTTLRTAYGVDTKNTATANLTKGDEWMNDFHRRLLAKADWPFLHRLRTATTVASTTFVNLPYDMDQVESVFVTVSSTRYDPKPAPSRRFWDQLHYTTVTSDTPEYWFIYNGQIGLWPRPTTAGNTISINGKVRVIDLSVADYTTGTITTTSTTSAVTTVTGSSTVWTAQMGGRWMRITYINTANTGDGVWYEISSVASATSLTLVRPYGGTAITAGSAAYTLGQMPLLPEAFQDLPEIYAAYRYWSKEKDERAAEFKTMYQEGVTSLFSTYGVNDLSMVLDDGEDRSIINPNLTINL
ncbi:hypothetical protein HY967_01585 [Candidatus Jorgensenbacteria bacterium]|nr:hypothetical protein [Candidatus Jorgensenbacteria bacterium]